MNKKKFIIIDGFDCTGKTTLIQRIKDQINSPQYQVEHGNKSVFSTKEDMSFINEDTEMGSYLTYTQIMDERYRHFHMCMQREEDIIIQDRGLFSTFIYNTMCNTSITEKLYMHKEIVKFLRYVGPQCEYYIYIHTVPLHTWYEYAQIKLKKSKLNKFDLQSPALIQNQEKIILDFYREFEGYIKPLFNINLQYNKEI